MKNVVAACAVILSLAGCTTTQDIIGGKKIESDAIVLSRITMIPANSPPPYIRVAIRPVIGPVGGIKPERGEPLVISTMMPGTYNWDDMLTVQYPGPRSLGGALPPFTAGRGCITYIGDITFDFTGSRPSVSIEQRKEQTLADFKKRYPKMFEANPLCQ